MKTIITCDKSDVVRVLSQLAAPLTVQCPRYGESYVIIAQEKK